jgi:hypothetical protein
MMNKPRNNAVAILSEVLRAFPVRRVRAPRAAIDANRIIQPSTVHSPY